MINGDAIKKPMNKSLRVALASLPHTFGDFAPELSLFIVSKTAPSKEALWVPGS
jgi:hypothetical protein